MLLLLYNWLITSLVALTPDKALERIAEYLEDGGKIVVGVGWKCVVCEAAVACL